jgi:glycosyltransferase involved in cell wall biosynthesis
MSIRYLFGPVPRAFAEQKLHGPRQAGLCRTFHPEEGEGDVLLRPEDSWEDVLARLPPDWQPDLLALWLPYTTIPASLWSAPLPRLGLAPDWNLMYHYYRHRLPGCEWAVTDSRGAELLQRDGLAHVRPGILCGCERAFLEDPWPEQPRDVDILVVGNFNPAVQRERMSWLARLARLGRRWKVVLRAGLFGDSYRRLLSRSRIVFHASSKHKVGARAFEAAAAGALIFQERDNRELPEFFHDRQECVLYGPDEAEELLEYYLEHEDQRSALAQAARARIAHYGFEDFWNQTLASLPREGPLTPGRASSNAEASKTSDAEELLTRCWQALQSSLSEDTFLIADLERAVRAQPDSAVLHNALGVVLGRQTLGRSTGPAAAAVAAECFRRALAREPGNVLAGLNLAESLAAAGQELAAGEAARRTLEQLQHHATRARHVWEGLPWGRSFDIFHVEWERAAWANAGRPHDEARAKHALVRCRLHSLLAQWNGSLTHAYEAAFLRPDLPSTRAALGMALLRAEHPCEALEHLRPAVAANPLDRAAARACFQTLIGAGDSEGLRAFVDDQRLLQQACPSLVPAEPWFSAPRPQGNELVSIVVVCCNQLEYTRLCLHSVLQHSRAPFELLLVDNGSSDGTRDYLEELRTQRRPARTVLLRNDTNLGYPAACNQALEQVRGQYLVFLHNDTVVTPGWLEGLIAAALHDWPHAGLVAALANGEGGPQTIAAEYTGLEQLDDFAARRRQAFAGKVQGVNRLAGFCLLASREALEQVGRLDERFGLGQGVFDDYCFRVREAGFRLLVAQDVFVHHFGNRTFAQVAGDTHEAQQHAFDLFRGKWGDEYTTGYLGSPPSPSPAQEQPEETPARLDPVVACRPARSLPGGEWEVPHSVCMIVRNEEHHLPDCLRSLAGIPGEIVVLDTGSSDATREIARQFGARVFDFPWPDSFAAARNECLRHARGKWILWVDADDRLDSDNRERLSAVLASLGDELDAYAMKVRSVLDAQRSSFRLLDQVRLFRNLPGVLWHYRVHEQILPAVNRLGGAVRWADVIIDHVGYVNAEARRGKLQRNLALLEKDHADCPDDGFTLFNLGWTLLDLGRGEDALLYLGQALEKTNPTSSTLRKVHHLLALAYRALDRRDEALSACREGLKHFPLDAEILHEQGMLLRDCKDFQAAEKSWLDLLDARRGQYFASEEVGLRGYRTRQLVAEIYRAQDRRLEAEVQWRAALAEQPDFEPAWMGLVELYLRGERWPELEYFLQDLESRGTNAGKIGWLRARGQVHRGEVAAARRTLESVIAQDPTALGPRVLLSQVLLQEGRDWAAAERALRDVLQLQPNHAETHHNLRVLLRRLGREGIATRADKPLRVAPVR